MRILYIISSTQIGGAEKALYEIATASYTNGNDVRVICLKTPGAVADNLKKAGISVKSLDKLIHFTGKTIRQIRAEILSFKPDIVHAMLFRAIMYTRMACAKLPVKLITSPHFNLAHQSVFHRMADRLLKNKDTLTVAESYTTAHYLVQHQHYRKEQVFLLPNGADEMRFYKDAVLRKTMREKQSFHVKTVVFICVARLVPIKNPLVLLQSFRNVRRTCPQAKLVYVGEGPERAKLEDFAKQSNIEKDVLFAGEQKNINDWLNMADVFVLPSQEESSPLALLEALRVGLPCIVSPAGDMPLWVQHGENGYVCPANDITLLSCFMTELAAQPDLREKMGQKSLQKAGNMKALSQQYHQIYQQVISNSFHVKTSQKE